MILEGGFARATPPTVEAEMTINFKQNGIRYSLLVLPKGLRESEKRLEDIKPDPELKPKYTPKDGECEN